jgi:hypothetical protein
MYNIHLLFCIKRKPFSLSEESESTGLQFFKKIRSTLFTSVYFEEWQLILSPGHGFCNRDVMDAASHPALLLVDGVSSIGALDFQFDAWRVDVAVTGSQKALSLPTGLAYVCASKKV